MGTLNGLRAANVFPFEELLVRVFYIKEGKLIESNDWIAAAVSELGVIKEKGFSSSCSGLWVYSVDI